MLHEIGMNTAPPRFPFSASSANTQMVQWRAPMADCLYQTADMHLERLPFQSPPTGTLSSRLYVLFMAYY